MLQERAALGIHTNLSDSIGIAPAKQIKTMAAAEALANEYPGKSRFSQETATGQRPCRSSLLLREFHSIAKVFEKN